MAGETIFGPVPTQAATIPAGLIATPFQFLLSDTERLRLQFITDDATLVLTVAGRILRSGSNVDPFSYTATPPSALLLTTQEFPVGPGFLLTLTVTVTNQSGAKIFGRNWAQVQLIQGIGPGATVLGTLVQDYVTTVSPCAWPGTPFRGPRDGPGMPVDYVGNAGIGGGAAVFPSLSSAIQIKVVSVTCRVVTSAAVGSRLIYFQSNTGVGLFGVFPSLAIQPASTTVVYTWAVGASNIDQSSRGLVSQGLADNLYAQYVDTSATFAVAGVGLDVNDNLNAPIMSALRWFDPVK